MCSGRATGNFGRGFDIPGWTTRSFWRMWLTSSKRKAKQAPFLVLRSPFPATCPTNIPKKERTRRRSSRVRKIYFRTTSPSQRTLIWTSNWWAIWSTCITPITRSGRHSLILKKAGFPKGGRWRLRRPWQRHQCHQMFMTIASPENSINNIEFWKTISRETCGKRMLSSPFHHLWSFGESHDIFLLKQFHWSGPWFGEPDACNPVRLGWILFGINMLSDSVSLLTTREVLTSLRTGDDVGTVPGLPRWTGMSMIGIAGKGRGGFPTQKDFNDKWLNRKFSKRKNKVFETLFFL